MKRLVTTVSLVTLLIALSAMIAWAKGPANVRNTIHNLSTSSPAYFPAYKSNNVTEVCVFCHTPHGGRIEGPLWNRAVPAATGLFTHYSSVTLSSTTTAGGSGRAVGDESRLCMSCHDGSATLDHLINVPNEIGTDPVLINNNINRYIVDIPDTPDAAIVDLSDDHPISFSYTAVVGAPPYSSGARVGELHTVAEALTAGVRFFGGAANRVECSSCHDPHVDYYSASGDPAYAPFLITPNAGSNLCRACHNK